MGIDLSGLSNEIIDSTRLQEQKKKSVQETSKDKFSDVLRLSLEKEGKKGDPPDTTFKEYTVKPGDTLWKIGVKLFQEDPYKIAKDNGIANPDLIFPGQKIKIYKSSHPAVQNVTASWYGNEYHRRPTASGERFDMYQNTLAHKTLPFGTVVRLYNPENGRSIIGKVNDRGPFIQGRDVDLSFGMADRLGLIKKGIGKLVMEIL
ncbi:MAG: septal ring lytic transglycosylase RlpA family protein [Deltaproteobacteria bacterium]|nr:septal ring lytic transglycosylase RlpA family protein [Deltaproteobacteria bacterium]